MKLTANLSRTLGAAALLGAFAASAQAQTIGCQVGVANGGAIPSTGTGGGGVYPTTLPPSSPSFTLNVASLPPGSTVVTEVKLIGLTHTWIADVQFVLTDPAGNQHNICNQLGGFSCDFGGDYTFLPQCTGGMALPAAGTCTGTTILTPGAYDQFFGTWPSGTNGINNTPMSSIPAQTGNWTLTAYDWAGGDLGNLTSFDVCFGTPPLPSAPGSSPALTGPANGSAFCANMVTLTWTAVDCATSYDLDVDGTVTNVASTSFSGTFAAGPHTWSVRAVNASGSSAYAASQSFSINSLVPWSCVTGGAGGSFPASGSVDGTWPTILPTGELSSTLAVSVPAGATSIAAVRLNGFSHTWSGDCQIVLTSPAGVNYNIFQQVDGVFAGGCGDDFNGDYAFVDATTGVDECGSPGIDFTCGLNTTLPSGAYRQFYGLWNSGDAGIVNVNLSAIPVASGNWTLTIYDWYILADNGALTSWDLCFDGGSAGPTNFCTAGTSSNGCVPAITATAQPSASLSSSCVINVANVEGQKSGLIFYGVNNTGFTPFAWSAGSSSFLCVKAPTQRMATQSSGGSNGACNGALSQDWNVYQAGNPTSLGNPFSAGDKVYAQAWYRDPPAAKTTNLSDGLEMTMLP